MDNDGAEEIGAIEAMAQGLSQLNQPAAEPEKPAAAAQPEAKPDPKPEPKPEVKPEAKPALDILPDDGSTAAEPEIPENLSPKASAHWRTLKQAKETVERELTELRQQMDALKKERPPKEEFERYKQERDELDAKLKAVAVEHHPEFQRYFNGRQQELLSAAKAIGGEKGDHIASLLSMPDSPYRAQAIDEAFSGIGPSAQARLGGILNEMERLNAERASSLANSSKSWEALRAKEQQAQQQRRAEFEAELETVYKKFPAFHEKENDPQWNAAVQDRRRMAQAIATGELSNAELAKAIGWAATGPALASQIKAMETAHKTRVAELEAEISALKAAQPGITNAEGSGGGDDDDVDFVQAVAKQASSAGLFRR